MPSQDSSDLAAARVFVAVVQAGSLSGAAPRLGVTRSAVSRRLSQLETHLGVRLLHRTSRALSLSEAGQRYYEHACAAVDAIRQAELAAMELQDEARGRLRVLAPMGFGRAQLAPRIGQFMQGHPQVRVSLVLDDRSGRLLDGDFDVALWAHTITGEAMTVRTVAQLRSVLCASPEYLESHDAPSVPSDLHDHPCLAYSYSEEAVRWTFERGGQAETVEVSGPMEVNNGDALSEWLLQGLGVGRLPTFIAAPHIAAGRLISLLPEYSMPSRGLRIVFADRVYLPEKVRAFVEFVVAEFGGRTAPWDEPRE